jgi:hypothetical protein
MKPPKSLHDV